MIRLVTAIFSTSLLAACMSQPPAPAVDRAVMVQTKAKQAAGPGYYTVKRGEGLYRIARENDVNLRDLMAWNGITNPDAIKEGQVLRIAPPSATEPVEAVVAKPIATTSGVEARPLEQAATVAVATNGLKREPRVGKEPYSDEAYARLNRNGDLPKAVEAKPESKPEVKPEATAPAAIAPAPDDVAWMWPTSGKLIAPFSEAGNKGLDFAGKAGDPVLAAGEGKVVYAGSGLRGFGELVIVKHNATYLSAYAHNRKILVKEGQQVSRGQKIAEMGNTDADSVKLHFEIRKQGKPVDPAQYLPKR